MDGRSARQGRVQTPGGVTGGEVMCMAKRNEGDVLDAD